MVALAWEDYFLVSLPGNVSFEHGPTPYCRCFFLFQSQDFGDGLAAKFCMVIRPMQKFITPV